ncbi:NAD(P)/FAD-dependent oxidoreductase [Priestia abyssalis]|uniref:NAD(P)/FAD-dependent oxidoreductase n=1 Tax=Priestia abyssalis TaxID=1221450 RepID=UPI0009948EE8|nr:FAD-binding oxidoreductase [Priestia abyssalis]
MAEERDRLTLLSLDMKKESQREAIEAKKRYEILKQYMDCNRYSHERKHHIVIVGGGIVGLMCAFYMRRQGFQVTVIEKKSFGGGASGRNGGGVLAMGRELAEIPFARLSIELWEALSSFGIDTKFEQNGHLMVARNDYELEKLKKAAQLYTLSGLKTNVLSQEEVQEVLPDIRAQMVGGIFSSIDSQSYPFTTVASLLKVLNRDSVALLSHTDVTGFETIGSRIRKVKTDKGNIGCDTVVLCTGPWTSEVAKYLHMDITITPRRSQIMVTEIVKQRRIQPFVSGNGLYLKQSHAGNLLYGGGGAWEQTGFETANTTFAIQLLTERFLELFPSYHSKQLLRAFAGTVEITLDHLPFFGRIGKYENSYISAGYNGHGYGMSAVMGKLLSCLITDHETGNVQVDDIEELLSFISPKRLQTMKVIGGVPYEPQ